jgi:phenylpropionate dioxygenase-like ring-hydroxylating dioxygenase large terminal subunit
VWIGDIDPVPVEEDLPVAMKVPGVTSLIHFTKVWTTNWALLFDNFIDGLHAPYLHRLSPQFLLRRLQYRVVDGKPNFQFVEHDKKILEASHVRAKSAEGLVYQMDFPGLGKFPTNNWWRIRSPKTKPKTNFIANTAPGSFLHVLPSYVHTVHKTLYFTQFIIPIDRFHLYNMCALTGDFKGWYKMAWKFYYNIFSITHDRMFIGQDHRVLRNSTFGPEHLSPLDQDVIYWRKFATRNARGYMKNQRADEGDKLSQSENAPFNTLREAF